MTPELMLRTALSIFIAPQIACGAFFREKIICYVFLAWLLQEKYNKINEVTYF